MIGPDQLSVKGGLWWPGQLEEPVSLAPELIQDAFVAVQTPAAGARGCAFDRRHHFYVADTERDRVAVLHDSGRVVHSWGRKGKEPGNFLTVEDVSIGPDGMVYVLDSALARVQVFTPDGRLIRAIGEVGCSPAGLAVGPDASVYIASACDDTVRRYAPSGKPLAEYRAGRDPKTQLAQPVDVAVGPGGVLYVADLRDRIVKLDPSSDTIEKSWPVPVGHGSGGANLTLGGRFLYLTDPDHSVLYSIDTSTGRIETLPAESDASPRSGVGPCATARGMAAVVRFPRCLGELLASCRDSRDRDSPR
jgi:DNA-binding beta-propeller fold protein YncE